MKKLISITSDKSVGCTFLDWSILFLSGQDRHYSSRLKRMVDIPLDPLSKGPVFNAHAHIRNHPSGKNITLSMIDDLLNNGADLETFYPFPMHVDHVIDSIGSDLDSAVNSESIRTKIQEFRNNDYRNLLETCLDLDIPLIYVESDPTPRGYYWYTRSTDRMMLSDKKPSSVNELMQEFQDFYFSDSLDNWKKLGLTAVWDQRERMALSIRPFENSSFFKFSSTRPYLHINCQDLWGLADDVILECFDYINLNVDTSRWEHWLLIAKKWQHMQQRNLRFYHQLDHIIESIVNNWYYPLPVLELWQEAIVQHCLIYKHDLNFKTWQLEKFPDNTQKLHQLLEPNIHKIQKLY